MALIDDTRNDLANDLLPELGSEVVHFSNSSFTTDKWGDSSTSFTSTTVTAALYNQGNVRNWESYGVLQSEVLEAAIPYTVSLGVRDVIYFDGVYYGLDGITKYPLPGGNLVTTVTLYKLSDQSNPMS